MGDEDDDLEITLDDDELEAVSGVGGGGSGAQVKQDGGGKSISRSSSSEGGKQKEGESTSVASGSPGRRGRGVEMEEEEGKAGADGDDGFDLYGGLEDDDEKNAPPSPTADFLPDDSGFRPPPVQVTPAAVPAKDSAKEDGAARDMAVGKRVRVSKMTWWTSDADLENLFADCGGSIVKIQFEDERNNGKSKGIALIDFSDADAASKAVEKDDTEVHGVKISVSILPDSSKQAERGTVRADPKGKTGEKGGDGGKGAGSNVGGGTMNTMNTNKKDSRDRHRDRDHAEWDGRERNTNMGNRMDGGMFGGGGNNRNGPNMGNPGMRMPMPGRMPNMPMMPGFPFPMMPGMMNAMMGAMMDGGAGGQRRRERSNERGGGWQGDGNPGRRRDRSREPDRGGNKKGRR